MSYQKITEAEKNRKEIIKQISENIGAPISEVEQIVNSQSEYVAYVMEHSGFETVMLPYLGKFLVNPKRLKYLNNKNLLKNGAI